MFTQRSDKMRIFGGQTCFLSNSLQKIVKKKLWLVYNFLLISLSTGTCEQPFLKFQNIKKPTSFARRKLILDLLLGDLKGLAPDSKTTTTLYFDSGGSGIK